MLNMKMRKGAVFCLVYMLLCQTGVNALELIDVTETPITVKGKTDAGITIAASVKDAEGTYYFYDEIKSDNEGNYVLTFELPSNIINKTVTVEAKPYGKAEEPVSFEFSGNDVRSQALSLCVQAVASGDANALSAVFDNLNYKVAFEMMGLPVSVLNANQAVKAASTISICETGTTLDTFIEDFNKLCFVQSKISSYQSGMDAFFDGSEFVFEGVKYSAETTSKQVWIKQNMISVHNVTLVSDAQNAYNKLNAYYLVNNAKYTELPALIEKYKQELGINGTNAYISFSAMDENKRNRIAEKIVTASGFGNLTDGFLKYLENAVLAVQTSVQSGGASSSGSGGNWVQAGNVVLEQNPVTNTNDDFHDVGKDAWYYTAVKELSQNGIVAGKTENTFNPEDSVKREEFLAMIMRMIGEQKESSVEIQIFNDVVPGAWYENTVKVAVNLGIASGYSDKVFGIGDLITRQDAAVFALRAAELMGYKITNEKNELFIDDTDISAYAKDSVYAMKNLDIVSGMGDGRYLPKTQLTRAQAAVIVYRLWKGGNN